MEDRLIEIIIEYAPYVAAGVISAVAELWAGYTNKFPKYKGVARRVIESAIAKYNARKN